jgi:hypothetical protein
MRRYINLIEAMQRQQLFYHGSSKRLPVGTVLKPRREDYEKDWNNTDFYAVLEHYRPANMLAHKDAVFMCDNPDDIDNSGGATDWLLTVEPLGDVQRHDLNWSSEISRLVSDDPDDIEAIQRAAENYWNGIPHHDENVWEYLTPSARVVAVEAY